MATVSPQYQAELLSLLRASSAASTNGLVEASDKERKRYWRAWTQWCELANMDALFSHGDPATTVATLQAFAEFVRRGSVGRGKQVGTQAVQVALRSVGAHFELAAKPNPCYKDGYTPKYWKALEQQIEAYRRQDPVPQPKLAVPVTVPHWCVATGLASTSPKARAVGDLTNVAFYYLLRVGEYTYLPPARKRRTRQFRVRDVKFWRNGHVIPLDSPDLLLADAGTLTLTNQKNGTKGAVIHNDATFTVSCPVRALARRVTHILSNTSDLDTPLSAYYDRGQLKHVLSSHINTAVKSAVKALKLKLCGFTARLVSSHSLRAGGAMAMKLNGEDRDTIRKQGRWSSDTFLMYIHEQIAAFSSGISARMSRHIPFVNLKGPTVMACNIS
jgi:integrase